MTTYDRIMQHFQMAGIFFIISYLGEQSNDVLTWTLGCAGMGIHLFAAISAWRASK